MYLFDTNIISELYKFRNQKIDPTFRAWISQIKPSDSFISCITLSEIQTGILLKQRKDKIQAEYLSEWFTQQVIPAYQDRTLAITADIALLAAQFHIPDRMDINDAYIAATAKAHHLILVTRNTKDFEKLGIKLFNPFVS